MPTPTQITATAKALFDTGEYEKKGNQTYCNFFVRDFSAQLFGGTPLQELVGRAKQQVANMASSERWTALGFKRSGTSAADEQARQDAFDKAQQLANAGTFVVAGAAAPKGTADPTYSGHVAVIVPSQLPADVHQGMVPSDTWRLRCPLIAHAGSNVFTHKGLNFGFGKKYKVNQLELYAFQAQDPAPAPTDFLGGFDLQRGDNDAQQRWGGQLRSHSGDYVAQLQGLLNELDFLIVGTVDGDFGRRTEWALREFQLYASAAGGAKLNDGTAAMPHLRLEAIDVPVGERYPGDALHGFADQTTREQLEKWVDDERRCPVVLTAFERSFNEPRGSAIVKDNLWNKDDFTQAKAHVHAWDASQLFEIPASEKDADGYIIVGKYTPALESGMLAQPISNHEWDGMEVLPLNLVGRDTGELTDAEKSTFRVIRAVSEVECYGYFDCLNAYDRGLMSAGLFHWTIGLTNSQSAVSKVDAGELGAYGSFLKAGTTQQLKDAYAATFQRFGLEASKAWGSHGDNLFVQNARKYVSYCDVLTLGGKRKTLTTRSECAYYAHWHWFYRFLMSSRTSPGFRRGMWDYCRLRLRDILTAPLRSDAKVDDVPVGGGGTRPAVLGDVFASEKGAALLLRCHVNSPGHVVFAGAASEHISDVIQAVRDEDPTLANGAPSGWSTESETKLIEKLIQRAKTKFPVTIRDTIETVANWPNARRADLLPKFTLKETHPLATSLSEERNFAYDETGLPGSPAPGPVQKKAIVLIGPLLNVNEEDKEGGVCIVPKDDGSGEIESILLQIGAEPEPMPDAVKGGKDPASEDDPPEAGAADPPPDLEPSPQAIPTLEIPVLDSAPIDFTTETGGIAVVESAGGPKKYFELTKPADGQPPKSFRATLDLNALLGVTGAVDGIHTTAELRASNLEWTAGVPTAGHLVGELRFSGNVLPQDIVWSVAASGNLEPAGVNLKKVRQLEDGSIQFPIVTTDDIRQLPTLVAESGYKLSGDVIIGPGQVNKYRLRFDGELSGDLVFNLGSSLAQLYASTTVGVLLDTDDILELQFSGERSKIGFRLDLFQEFRKSVVNNQWSKDPAQPSKTHLIEIDRNLGGYGDLTIRWKSRLPQLPDALLARVLNEMSSHQVNSARRLQSLVGSLPVRKLSSRVNFDACDGGLIGTDLLPKPTAIATFDFGTKLAPGDWQLHSTWVESNEQADVAPIELLVGSRRFLGSMNQQLPPEADISVAGRDFQRLILFDADGTEVEDVKVSDGESVRVRIHNAVAKPATGSDGGRVVADAVVLRSSDGASTELRDDDSMARYGSWTQVTTGGHGGSYHIADPADVLDEDVHLWLCLKAQVKSSDETKTVFAAEGRFTFPIAKRVAGVLQFCERSFATGSETTLKVIQQDYVSSFEQLISIGIPQNTVFRFSAAPGRNQFEYLPTESAAADASKIRLRVPATKGDIFAPEPEGERFTFELDAFKVHSGGVDLRGRVLTEEVSLGLQKRTALKRPLSVKGLKPPAEDPKELQIGEVAFQDSRLIFAQVQAAAEISYFDDGRGTFTLTVAEKDVNHWDIIADLEITGSKEFHVDRLYTTFTITGFQFSTTYNTGNDQWSSDGSISGSIGFAPPEGNSSESMGALSDLFGGGVTVGFEDWNPLDLADTFSFTIQVQPRSFDVAKVMNVTLHGIQVDVKQALPGGFKLLGDVTLKNLPGIDAELTFGGITLMPITPVPGSLPVPGFKIDRIGASLCIPGSFTASGTFEHVDNEIEDGFKGDFSLDTEVLPPINGVIQVTALKPRNNRGRVPSVALYLEAGTLDIPLFAGFYLRSLGFGLGINRGLRGLIPDKTKNADETRNVQQRLLEVVDNPSGLPSPARLDSWEPDRPASSTSPPLWMFVASGLITFGKFPNDQPHTLAGSALLSLNYEGEVFLGVNLWLFTSPDETRRVEFQQRPAARGGILLSPKERVLFGKFRTLQNPALSSRAPKLLSEVLSQVETSMVFQADPNGFLLQVGWPWETKIRKNIGPLKGTLTSGFRFGIYRGIVSFGLNWAIRMELKAESRVGFSTWIGRAEASFKVEGEGDLRVAFVGALDHGLKPYLLGDVRLSATIKLIVSAECRLSKKIGFAKIRLRISFRKSLELSISAALTMALDPKPELGARGTARVSVSVGRYSIGGNVDFVVNGGLIDHVRQRINELLPPPLPNSAGPREFPMAREAAAAPQDATEQCWTYLFRRFEKAPGESRVRVVLFPSVGQEYPALVPADQSRFDLKLKAGVVFKGFVADATGDFELKDQQLSWHERADAVIRTAADVAAGELERDGRDRAAGDANGSLTLADIMEALAGRSVGGLDDAEEVVDARPWNPSPEHSDDPAAAVADRDMPSPNLRADTEYDRQVALASGEQQLGETQHPDGADGLEPATLLHELVELMQDAPEPWAADYELAPHLRLVLEFEDPIPEEPRRDPVKAILADDRPLTVDGSSVTLTAIYNSDGQTEELPEYDIVTGPAAQSDELICLNWELWREGTAETTVAAGVSRPDMQHHYAELIEYRVQRRIVGDTDEPLRKKLRPAFLDASAAETSTNRSLAKRPLVRPQFQYVDRELGKVREGDAIIYDVEAWSTDRRLSQTTIVVQRRTVKVLPPLAQSQVLCVIRPPADSVRNTPDAELQLTVLAKDYDHRASEALGGQEFRLTAEHLRLRYRIVPASTQGLYARSSGRIGESSWSRGVSQRPSVTRDATGQFLNTGFEIEFADPAQEASIPWSDSKPLPGGLVAWKRVESRPTNEVGTQEQILEGFTAELAHGKMLDAIRAVDSDWNPETALELFIGVEPPAGAEATQPLQRSPLVRCRAAVAGQTLSGIEGDAADASTTPQGRALQMQLTRGATVDALEVVPAASERRFVPQHQIDVVVDYGSVIVDPPEQAVDSAATASPARTRSEVNDAVMTVRWPHDDSLLGRWHNTPNGELLRDEFDPVVGYRLHRTDLLDPAAHPLPADGSLPAEPVLTVMAVSETEYRARPSTIPVVGLRRDKDNDGNEFVERDWSDVDRFQFDATVPLTQELTHIGPDNRQAVRVPLPQHLSTDLFVACDALAKRLNLVRRKASLSDDVVVHCRPTFPVLPNVLRALTPTDGYLQRFVAFSEAFDWRNDPCGWSAAEAMGMSCECTFATESGVPIHAEQVRAVLESVDPAVQAIALPRITPVFFQADDGQTLLNVVRLTLNRAPAGSKVTGNATDAKVDVRGALLLQLSALPPVDSQSSQSYEAAREELQQALGDVLTRFVNEVELRLKNFGRVINPGSQPQHALVLAQRRELRSMDAAETEPDAAATAGSAKSTGGRAALRLPVRENAPLECRLPIPDRWARDYRLSIEIIRRYDVVRSLSTPNAAMLQPPDRIPAAYQRRIRVHRSRSLGDLNLFATALPGAIQAGIFRHVASFAATSNAEQKARGEYGPLAIYLERKIANQAAAEAIINTIPDRVGSAANPDDVWAAYQSWLNAAGHLATNSNLKLIVENGEAADRLHLTVPPVAQQGIYGVDCYAYTDLPPGYEYRVCAQARAGMVRSRVAKTGFVTPMFDCEEDYPEQTPPLPRMQPQAYPRPFAALNFEPQTATQSSLGMTVPLVFSRFHLRPAIRPLWVAAERPLDGIDGIGYGSFPDLQLKYRVLLLENYLAVRDEPSRTKVLVPLFEIAPPDLSAADPTGQWFTLDGVPAGVRHGNPHLDSDTASNATLVRITQGDGSAGQGGPDFEGSLMFDIQLRFGDPATSGYTSVLKAASEDNAVEQVLFLTVSREGKMSDLSVNRHLGSV